MYSSIDIKGYRSIGSLHLENLGRVNLLVGRNNSGKTSVLEAISLLASGGSLERLNGLLDHRGELVVIEDDRVAADPRHIFPGHDLLGSAALIIGAGTGVNDRLRIGGHVTPVGSAALQIQRNVNPMSFPQDLEIPLTPEGGLIPTWGPKGRNEDRRIAFVYASSNDQVSASESFDNYVSLQDAEEPLLASLRTVHPDLEQIRTIARGRRGGAFIVRQKGQPSPVPLGSLGAGVLHMLKIAIALAEAKGSVICVDEIDTGLHYTVMTDLWKMILDASKRLDVQVFATTHSMDCWTSLGEVLRAGSYGDDAATVIRLEDGGNKAISYPVAEIAAAAAADIEVR